MLRPCLAQLPTPYRQQLFITKNLDFWPIASRNAPNWIPSGLTRGSKGAERAPVGVPKEVRRGSSGQARGIQKERTRGKQGGSRKAKNGGEEVTDVGEHYFVNQLKAPCGMIAGP